MSIKPQIKPSKPSIPDHYAFYELHPKTGPVYVGRTTDTKNALHFAQQTVKGKLKVEVRFCTADQIQTVDAEWLELKLKEENRQAGQIKRAATLAKKKMTNTTSHLSVKPEAYGAFA